MPRVRVENSRAGILREILYPQFDAGENPKKLNRQQIFQRCQAKYAGAITNRGRLLNWKNEQSFLQQISMTYRQWQSDRLVEFPSFNRLHKNYAREQAVCHGKPKAAVALFLPSNECLCPKAAIHHGIIDRSTFAIMAEKEAKKVPSILTFCKANFDNFYIHDGEVQTLDLPTLTKRVGKLDYAFLDFCGEFKQDIAQWTKSSN